jgi:prepilin-type N-terminal cleavage/methylation domain-containing protein
MKTSLLSTRAFSLIELLVALSILAVVTALIVPRFLNVREQAADTTAQAQIKSLNNIYNQWIALGGTAPAAATASNVVGFLATVPASSTTARAVAGNINAFGGCTDTLGDFASTSIMLSGVTVNQVTAIANVGATAPDGFYGAALNLKVGNYYWPVNYAPANATPFSLGARASFAK